MKNAMKLLLIVLFVIAGLSQAQSILWVSDCWSEITPHDQGYVDLLVDEGYTVTRMNNPRDMTVAKRDEANGYDLVIVGRHMSSGSYDDTASDGSGQSEVNLWNSITAPLLNQNAYIARSSYWKWQPSTSVITTSDNLRALVPDDPIFAGVTLDENNEMDYVQQHSVAVMATTTRGNETLVAIRAVAGFEYTVIARWTTGQEYYFGGDQYAGGPRMLFNSAQSGNGDGTFNLTPQGAIIFLNAVYEMSGATFNRKPAVIAGTDHITNIGTTVALDAMIYDPEGASLTITWSKIAGPGTAIFSDINIEDPTVSFDAKGTYTLQLEVVDGPITVTDTCNVYIRDPADNRMVAHWDFEGLPDPNTLVDTTGNGFNGVFYGAAGQGPSVAPGHITDSAVAGDFSAQNSYWEVPGALDGDPNFNDDIATGATIAIWAKADAQGTVGTPVIMGFGVDAFRFQIHSNKWNLAQTGVNLLSTRPVFDGFWHNVVGVYDGPAAQLRIYIDGVLDGTLDTPSGYLLTTGAFPLQIGNRADADRPWPGLIDDLQVYNYPLSDAAIAELATAGDVPPYLTAGEDQTVQFKGNPVPLDATRIIDDGIPASMALTWSVTKVPEGVDPGNVVFNPDNTVEDPMVSFPHAAGTYTLKLTGNDGDVEVSDEISIIILIPTCADVLADGLGLTADLSGPAGEPDCKVDIYDLAALAKDWLKCNDPEIISCEWPY